MRSNKERFAWGMLRLSMGWIFLWPFLDKVYGFGFATETGRGWLDGTSPTFGFLTHATKGPFAEYFQSIAGYPAVDWLFMIGLLLIGLALLLGIGVRIAGYSGALMLILMYLAAYMPPEHNPFLDDHLIYAFLLIALTFVESGNWIGFGKWWGRKRIVRRYPILK